MSTIITDEFPYTAHYVQALLNISQEELDHYIAALNIVPRSDAQTGRPIFSHRDIDLLKRSIPGKPGRSTTSSPILQPTPPTLSPAMTQNAAPTGPIPPLGEAPPLTDAGQDLRTFGAAPRPGSEAAGMYSQTALPPTQTSTPTYAEAMPSQAQPNQYPPPEFKPSYSPEYKTEASKFESRFERKQEAAPAYTVAPPPPSPLANAPASRGIANPPASRSGALGAPSRDAVATMVETVSQVKDSILKDMSRMLDDKLTGLDDVVVELIRCKSENDSLRRKLEDLQGKLIDMEEELTTFVPFQFGLYRKETKK